MSIIIYIDRVFESSRNIDRVFKSSKNIDRCVNLNGMGAEGGRLLYIYRSNFRTEISIELLSRVEISIDAKI